MFYGTRAFSSILRNYWHKQSPISCWNAICKLDLSNFKCSREMFAPETRLKIVGKSLCLYSELSGADWNRIF